MVVVHAMDNPIFMKVSQMQEAVKLGAMIEFDYRRALPGEQLEAIRAVGPQHIILSEFLMLNRRFRAAPAPDRMGSNPD